VVASSFAGSWAGDSSGGRWSGHIPEAVAGDFPDGRNVEFVLSTRQARTMVEKALREWGADRDDPSTIRHTIVRLYMGGRNATTNRRRVPVGSFHIRWNSPTGDQATIDRLEWDPALGGSDEEVCQVIDSLAGWHLSR